MDSRNRLWTTGTDLSGRCVSLVGSARRAARPRPARPCRCARRSRHPPRTPGSRAEFGSRSSSLVASSAARSGAPRWCTARLDRTVACRFDGELDHPSRRPARRAHLLQRHDLPTCHVQQRLHRQRGAERSRRRGRSGRLAAGVPASAGRRTSVCATRRRWRPAPPRPPWHPTARRRGRVPGRRSPGPSPWCGSRRRGPRSPAAAPTSSAASLAASQVPDRSRDRCTDTTPVAPSARAAR